MQLITIVETPKNIPDISHDKKLLILGSCFAENIGTQLKQNQFDVDINPFGILYNPLSISQSLNDIILKKIYTHNDIFEYNNLWHSDMHHGSFSNNNAKSCLGNINNRISNAHLNIQHSNCYIIITFGTAYVYYRKNTDKIISNCHKQPERFFDRKKLSSHVITEIYKPLIKRLKNISPNIKILFTVSPIRHARDGMHENQLSKATLLLAIDELCHEFPDVAFYFPSYEIMLDELRDYRFYKDDFIHPNSLAIEYIWHRFASAVFSSKTKSIIDECSKINKLLQHKPFHPNSKDHQLFLSQTVLKIELLKKKYPNLEFNFDIPQIGIEGLL